MNSNGIANNKTFAFQLELLNFGKNNGIYRFMWRSRAQKANSVVILLKSIAWQVIEAQCFAKNWASIICNQLYFIWTVASFAHSKVHWHIFYNWYQLPLTIHSEFHVFIHSASHLNFLFPSLWFYHILSLSEIVPFQQVLSSLHSVYTLCRVSKSLSISLSILHLSSSFFPFVPSLHFFSYFHCLSIPFTTFLRAREVNHTGKVLFVKLFSMDECKAFLTLRVSTEKGFGTDVPERLAALWESGEGSAGKYWKALNPYCENLISSQKLSSPHGARNGASKAAFGSCRFRGDLQAASYGSVGVLSAALPI